MIGNRINYRNKGWREGAEHAAKTFFLLLPQSGGFIVSKQQKSVAHYCAVLTHESAPGANFIFNVFMRLLYFRIFCKKKTLINEKYHQSAFSNKR